MAEEIATEQNKTEEPRGVGRPTEYTPEFLMKARDYLVQYEKLDEVVPSIEGLALFTGVARRTLHYWAEDTSKEEFLHILEHLLAKQGKILVNKGLSGIFNSTISKLMLSKHDYIEKTENSNTHRFDDPAEKDKAKLDAILNGTPKTTTEQGSSEGSDKRDTSQPAVPVQ